MRMFKGSGLGRHLRHWENSKEASMDGAQWQGSRWYMRSKRKLWPDNVWSFWLWSGLYSETGSSHWKVLNIVLYWKVRWSNGVTFTGEEESRQYLFAKSWKGAASQRLGRTFQEKKEQGKVLRWEHRRLERGPVCLAYSKKSRALVTDGDREVSRDHIRQWLGVSLEDFEFHSDCSGEPLERF